MPKSQRVLDSSIQIRLANKFDISNLVELEQSSFITDKLAKRNFKHLISKGNSVTLLAEKDSQLLGYVTVLFRKNLSISRIYSIAVNAKAKGIGIGRTLVSSAENISIDKGCTILRLEIRQDNQASLGLFHAMDYNDFGFYPNYYEDGEKAIRLQKYLRPIKDEITYPIPLYLQSLDFTCGPSALMMAMQAHHKKQEMSIEEEIKIWREATTIFMTSGHGGCGPHGLALAAKNRGFKVKLWTSTENTLFIDSVRQAHKKEIVELVQKSFVKELKSQKVPIKIFKFTVNDLRKEIAKGAIPVMLISSWLIYGEKFPHWVTVTGVGEKFVYFHDSWKDPKHQHIAISDLAHIPVRIAEFEKMCRYGSQDQRAVILIYPKEKEL